MALPVLFLDAVLTREGDKVEEVEGAPFSSSQGYTSPHFRSGG
jgi:hypothetical protein